MAKRKTPVDPDAIDLLGKRKDALLLERYATENGASALPFLERAFAEGSPPLRLAATAAIAELDAERAEGLVLAVIAALGKKWTSKQWKLSHELLLSVATPTAVATFLAAGGVVKTPVSPRVQAALLAHVVAAAPGAGAAELRALLQGTGVLADQGSKTLEALDAVGVTIDVDLAVDASRYATAQARSAALSRYVGEAAGRKAVVKTLTGRDDPAWIAVLTGFIEERDVFLVLVELRDPSALEKLRAIAGRDGFDPETKDACYRLGSVGDPQASAILVRWLEDPIAEGAAPMLLTALAGCGDARAVAAIERVRTRQPTRAGFFDHAIQSIRARVGPSSH